jgi:hypothetical protein
MKQKLKPGYTLRDGDQVPTRRVSVEEIIRDPKFAQGVKDARAGRPFPADFDAWEHGNDQWCYERGRQWAAVMPRDQKFKSGDRIPPRALEPWLFGKKDIL